jgi:hypothetical protein
MARSGKGRGIQGQFVAHRRELIESTAWKHKSVPLWRIFERLEIEHMCHAGACNGSLSVSYGQFEDHGVSRNDIPRAIQLGKDLGLLKVKPNPKKFNGQIRPDNLYTLTYLSVDGRQPTDEWLVIKEVTAKTAMAQYKAARQRKNTNND